MNWETVIGLETHVELSTRTKIFCGCTTAYGGEPNTQCCPVCTGMPGTLPVLNRAALDYSVRAGLALGCKISRYQRFDRKNYFYPDLPKAYQISQFCLPLGTDGAVTISVPEGRKTIRIHELHMEEDAGKLIHDTSGCSRVDFNRCGIPLVEIVTEPDFRTGAEVIAYLDKLKSILTYLGVSDCKMQEGSLRCDINLSVRPVGCGALGTRTEMKNLNSFRAILKAIDFESRRQIALLEGGGTVLQETRRWDEEREESVSMRSKENARDYRYFPEPDLPPVVLSEGYLQAVRAELPELAEEKRARYISRFGLSEYDAALLTEQRPLAEFFEHAVALGGRPKTVANWLLGEVLRILKEKKLEAGQIPVTPGALIKLISLVEKGGINRPTAVKVFHAMFETNVDPEEFVRSHGLEQVSDTSMVERAVNQVFAEHPKSVADYRAGKEKAYDFLVGQTMRLLRGKADPKIVNEILHRKLQS